MKLPWSLLNAKRAQKVIVGLGNPGKEYVMTRHNFGDLVVRGFAGTLGWELKQNNTFDAQTTKGVVDGVNVHLLCPTTYMNNSGIAVRRYLDYYKLTPEDLVVVTDDVALPFGQLRLKPSGSPGGHNGLKSIQQHIGTTHYIRLRMGIGNFDNRALVEHVLSVFTPKELELLPQLLQTGVNALRSLLNEPIQLVMNKINKVETSKEE